MKVSGRFFGFAVVFACLATTSTVGAQVIFYQFSGTGTGSFGANTFSDAAFAITGTANTNNVMPQTGPVSEDNFIVSMDSVSVAVSGIGSANLFLPAEAFSSYGLDGSDVGLADGFNMSPNYTTMLSLSGSSFSGFQLNSAWGPATGAIGFAPGTGFDCIEIGQFMLTSVSSLTFQSYFFPSPEPTCTAFIGIGLAVFVGRIVWSRRSKASQS
jgi:hypothetical protein